MSNSGLGTASQTFGAQGNSNQSSQTNPFAPTQPNLNLLISQLGTLGGTWNDTSRFLAPQDQANYQKAQSNLDQLPNFGPAAAQTGANFLQTGGDPTGILRRESQQIGYGDPRNAPGMQDVLNTIRNDVSNQVNSQFAGAGRSLSGLNEQTLARGLSQGEAVPLLNQYNQDIANQLGIQGAAVGNIGQGLSYGAMAPGLAEQIPMAKEALTQQENMLPYQYLGANANLLYPAAGLGGSVQGTQNTNQVGSGTATNSLLSQLGQGLGLLNPLGAFLGTL